MIELQGKYASAKVFIDQVDNASVSQVISLLNQCYSQGSRIRMMPDIQAGVGCTVGTTMTIRDKICPNIVGVDIGCGMETVKVREKTIDLRKLDVLIHERIPSGFSIRDSIHPYLDEVDLDELFCAKHIHIDRVYKSIGTLGGGNHFIEVDKDDQGNLYIVIHSGSRILGLDVANFYQKAAFKSLTTYSKEEIRAVAHSLELEGKKGAIASALKNLPPKNPGVVFPLAYVEGVLFDQYLHDMKIAQKYAELNRKAIMREIIKGLKLHVTDQFTTVHNYIDTDSMILRKGSVSARAGERLIIPINMRDGSLICTGKGNEDWNYSAPHGAGRLMSRKDSKESFTVSEFKKQMNGIYTTSINSSTLDECPMAYKNMDDIVNNIGPTVDIDCVIKPIYNFKAGSDD